MTWSNKCARIKIQRTDGAVPEERLGTQVVLSSEHYLKTKSYKKKR